MRELALTNFSNLNLILRIPSDWAGSLQTGEDGGKERYCDGPEHSTGETGEREGLNT